MTDVIFTVDDAKLREVLDGTITRAGSQRAAAAQLGISGPYLSDVLHGRRSISALAGRLGYRSLTVHVPDGEEPPITTTEAARLIDGLRRRRIAGATP